jgi:hypothetical protein
MQAAAIALMPGRPPAVGKTLGEAAAIGWLRGCRRWEHCFHRREPLGKAAAAACNALVEAAPNKRKEVAADE